MQALSVKKNNYLVNEKSHTVYTPPPICKWLHDIIVPELKNIDVVFDPAVGTGNLLEPFKNECVVIGNDLNDQGPDNLDQYIKSDFLDWLPNQEWYKKVSLVNANPPYNHNKDSRKKWGKSKLLPELFAEKIFTLFGKNIPLVLFVPMGVRLNTRCYTEMQGSRYRKIRDNWGKITTIVSLPLDVFHNPYFDQNKPEVRRNPKKNIYDNNLKRMETHQEILIFNIPSLPPHLCLPEKVIEDIRTLDKMIWR